MIRNRKAMATVIIWYGLTAATGFWGYRLFAALNEARLAHVVMGWRAVTQFVPFLLEIRVMVYATVKIGVVEVRCR
jgi:hypothetical protein